MSHPNAPTDPLARAQERMRVAVVEQLREALRLQSEGHQLPTFAPFLAPFRALRGAV